MRGFQLMRKFVVTTAAFVILVAASNVLSQTKTPREQPPAPEQPAAPVPAQPDGPKSTPEKKLPPASNVKRKPVPPNVDPTASRDAIFADLERHRRNPGDFSIASVAGSPILFNVTLSDTLNRVSVTSMMNVSQLRSFAAILAEARKFGALEEGVGRQKPVTTRFYTDEDPSYFVDVAKLGIQTQFFLTMKSRETAVTVDAGTVKRNEKWPATFFDSVLTSVTETIAPKTAN
jgi:hypothetical protein